MPPAEQGNDCLLDGVPLADDDSFDFAYDAVRIFRDTRCDQISPPMKLRRQSQDRARTLTLQDNKLDRFIP